MPIDWPEPSSPGASSSSSSSSSLPSYPSSEDSFDQDDQAALIQEEWDESLRQLEQVISLILVPFFGKWYGRRFAYWAYDRYKIFGLTRNFFFGLS